jgi:hypothetical protein
MSTPLFRIGSRQLDLDAEVYDLFGVLVAGEQN